MHNLGDSVKVVTALESNVMNNDTDGTGVAIDMNGFTDCLIIANIGASGDTLSGSVKFTPILQEGSDGTNFTNVDSSDIYAPPHQTAFTLVDDPAEDSVIQVIEYLGDKRYLRLFIDTTGTHTNGTPVGAVAILSNPRQSPRGY